MMTALKITPQTSGFLPARRAAQLLGVSRATVWRWVAEGIIPSSATLRCGCRTRVAAWWCLQPTAPSHA
jgi:excisionase family DNA binding protein